MAKMQKCKKSTKTTQKENTELPVVLPKATLKALEDERARLLKCIQQLQPVANAVGDAASRGIATTRCSCAGLCSDSLSKR